MLLAAESDDLAPWAGKSEGRIYASVLSEQLSQSERTWRKLMRGERLSGRLDFVRPVIGHNEFGLQLLSPQILHNKFGNRE